MESDALKVRSAVCSSAGKKMKINQDNFYINGFINESSKKYVLKSFFGSRKEQIFSVCDGMGGEKHGEIASILTAQSLKSYCKQYSGVCFGFEEHANRFSEAANKAICDYMDSNGHERMGSTVAVLCVSPKSREAIAANIGDSKVFLVRNGCLKKLSEDHNNAQSLVALGVITEEEARTHPERSKLTQHLGIYPSELILEPHISDTVMLEKNDVFILCSDGLTEMLTNSDIVEVVAKEKRVKAIAKYLVDIADKNGGNDNITAAAVQIY